MAAEYLLRRAKENQSQKYAMVVIERFGRQEKPRHGE